MTKQVQDFEKKMDEKQQELLERHRKKEEESQHRSEELATLEKEMDARVADSEREADEKSKALAFENQEVDDKLKEMDEAIAQKQQSFDKTVKDMEADDKDASSFLQTRASEPGMQQSREYQDMRTEVAQEQSKTDQELKALSEQLKEFDQSSLIQVKDDPDAGKDDDNVDTDSITPFQDPFNRPLSPKEQALHDHVKDLKKKVRDDLDRMEGRDRVDDIADGKDDAASFLEKLAKGQGLGKGGVAQLLQLHKALTAEHKGRVAALHSKGRAAAVQLAGLPRKAAMSLAQLRNLAKHASEDDGDDDESDSDDDLPGNVGNDPFPAGDVSDDTPDFDTTESTTPASDEISSISAGNDEPEEPDSAISSIDADDAADDPSSFIQTGDAEAETDMDTDTETDEQFSQKFNAYHNLQKSLRKGM